MKFQYFHRKKWTVVGHWVALIIRISKTNSLQNTHFLFLKFRKIYFYYPSALVESPSLSSTDPPGGPLNISNTSHSTSIPKNEATLIFFAKNFVYFFFFCPVALNDGHFLLKGPVDPVPLSVLSEYKQKRKKVGTRDRMCFGNF